MSDTETPSHEEFFTSKDVEDPLRAVLVGIVHDFEALADSYKSAAGGAEKRCKDILKDPGIAGLVMSRAKDKYSLREKLVRLVRALGAKPPTEAVTKERIQAALHDLAAVRITLYFPDDVPDVTKEVASRFEIPDGDKAIMRFGPRHDTRYRQPLSSTGAASGDSHTGKVATDPASQQRDDQAARRAGAESSGDAAVGSAGSALANQGTATEDRKLRDILASEYSLGVWEAVSVDGVVQRWMNQGYRAVHLLGNYEINEPTPRRVKVEIQITTVVMHAWTEVEHDIIYKNKHGLPDNNAMNRMLDGNNGLAITSEILLQQLRQTYTELRVQDEKDVTDTETLRTWLTVNYTAADPRWATDKFYFIGALAKALRLTGIKNGRELRQVIDETSLLKAKLEVNTPAKWFHDRFRYGNSTDSTLGDLTMVILTALGQRRKVEAERWPSATSDGNSTDGTLGDLTMVLLTAFSQRHKVEAESTMRNRPRVAVLYDMLLASNALSLMFQMHPHLAYLELCGGHAKWLEDEWLANFNDITRLLLNPQPTDRETFLKLGDFAQKFLNHAAWANCRLWMVAVTLSKLWAFVNRIGYCPSQSSPEPLPPGHTVLSLISKFPFSTNLLQKGFAVHEFVRIATEEFNTVTWGSMGWPMAAFVHSLPNNSESQYPALRVESQYLPPRVKSLLADGDCRRREEYHLTLSYKTASKLVQTMKGARPANLCLEVAKGSDFLEYLHGIERETRPPVGTQVDS